MIDERVLTVASSIRRVRCDRTRPSCQRCSSTGRVCDGYIDTAARHSSHPAAEEAALRNLPGFLAIEPEDRRSLHYFQQSTAPELAGGFADDFWTRLVIQVGHREDCVRYMVLALASLHESLCTSSALYGLRARAIGHYTKALRALNHHIASHQSAALDVTLLCSILCVTFEWLRADNSAALVHLRAGLLLLLQWHEAALSSISPCYPSLWSPSGHFIRSALLPIYTRFFVQVQTVCDHGLSLPPVEASHDGVGRGFANLTDARDGLYEVLSKAYHSRAVDAARGRDRKKAGPHMDRSMSTRRAHALWCRRLDGFLTRFPEAGNTLAAYNLRILREATTIVVEIEGMDDEADLDCFTSRFGSIVELVEQLYSMKATTFSPDMSVMSALYYVGVKCRHPAITEKAIGLLETALRREGIWHSIDAIRFAPQLINAENNRALKRPR